MPDVDAWCALADEVAGRGDAVLTGATREALLTLGLSDPDRRELSATVAGREDPAGQLLLAVVDDARTVPVGSAPVAGAAEPVQMDAALALSREILAGPPETMPERLRAAAREVLANLPADAAGSFVSGLVAASTTLTAQRRTAALSAVLDGSRTVTLGRLPVASVVVHAVSSSLSPGDEQLVAKILAGASPSRLLSGVLLALRDGADQSAVIRLLALVARESASTTGALPTRKTTAKEAAGSKAEAGGRERVLQPTTRWRSAGLDRRRAPETATDTTGGAAPATRTAYPRVDIDAHRAVRPEVAIVDQPFDVTVGLAKYHDPSLAQTGGITLPTGTATELELVLVYDPTSLVAQGDTRLSVTVSDDDPYPSVTVPFVAQYRPDLPSERRIGVHYLRDGQVVGFAWRTVVVVTYERDVATAPPPVAETDTLLDLEPLLGADLPDLILSVCASDGVSARECVWTAVAASDVTVPDLPRTTTLASDPQDVVTEMRDVVSQSEGELADFLKLAGKATRVGDAVPESIRAVLRTVIEDPKRTAAPAILLLAEEVVLPWELAVFDPPLASTWGGISPFLGSHAAISRWPLTQHKPRPTPRPTVSVRRAAVLTADYTGVMSWNELPETKAEVAYVTGLFAPPAVPVTPSLADVLDILSGNPPTDLLHVALHGQFDSRGDQSGLVLLDTDDHGALTTTPLYFTPDQVLNGRLDDGPFVFLNACQVGSDKKVLADNGGFASTLLQIGAAGVVAPLWNVRDETSASFARDFYAATWAAADGAEPVSAAEAVRALRARYTRRATAAKTPGVDATLIAFQVFGHPRLRLNHS